MKFLFLMVGIIGFDILRNFLKREKIYIRLMELLQHWQQEL